MFFANRKQLEAKLRQVMAAFDALDKAHVELIKETERLRNRAFLVDIQREGRTNKFVFMRASKMHQIETMGMWSDTPSTWRKDLLE